MNNDKNKHRLTPRTIAIIVLAVVVLAEGAFLLLRRKPDSSAAGKDAAVSASASPETQQDADGDGKADDAEVSPDGSDAPEVSTAPDDKKSDEKKPDNQNSDNKNAPAQTPAVSVPPENQGKAYAGEIAVLANYAKSPTEGTIAYLLGGELLGEQMQKFLPALLNMSGQTVEALQAELDTALNLPTGTTSLTITGEQALSADDINDAREQVRTLQKSFAAIAAEFADYPSFTDADWASIGSDLGISAADAKRMLTDITTSSETMSGLLSGADVTEGYRVTLTTNTGATMQTNVYCIAGKWVTSAFFNLEFT